MSTEMPDGGQPLSAWKIPRSMRPCSACCSAPSCAGFARPLASRPRTPVTRSGGPGPRSAVTRLGHKTAPDTEIERRVGLRLSRQGLLSRPKPPKIWSVMDEAVLRRPVGGHAVMRARLKHLLKVADLPHVTLQVAPFASGGHTVAGGSFTLLRFQERDLPDVVYIEQLTGAIYLDQRPDVEHYLEVVDQLSGEALTPAASKGFIERVAQETLGRHRDDRRRGGRDG